MLRLKHPLNIDIKPVLPSHCFPQTIVEENELYSLCGFSMYFSKTNTRIMNNRTKYSKLN